MTSYITSTIIGTGSFYSLTADYASLVLLDGVILASTDSRPFGTITGLNATLEIFGTVGAETGTSVMGTAVGAAIHIGATGRWITNGQAPTSGALYFRGEDQTFLNEGTLYAPGSIAVLTSLTGAHGTALTNTGTIQGASGVSMGWGISLVNSGLISASTFGDAANDWHYNNGVVLHGTDGTVTNLAGGVILATGNTGSGVRFTEVGGGGSLDNWGTIQSLHDYGVNLGQLSSGQATVTVFNAGSITGGAGAYLGSVNTDVLTNTGMLHGDVDMGAGNDTVRNSGSITGSLWLGDGNDTFDGRGGTVTGTVFGGLGNDIYTIDNTATVIDEVSSADGTDMVFAWADYALADGIEWLLLQGTAHNGFGNALDNVMVGNIAANLLGGGEGADTIVGGDGADTLIGDAGADSLRGERGNDQIFGDDDNDYLNGGVGADLLNGGAGNDTLVGDWGNDTLVGDVGADIFWAGNGADVFVYNALADSTVANTGRDRINVFELGVDRIDLSALDAIADTEGNDAFSLVGSFSHTAGELIARVVNTHTYLEGDVNGDGVADFSIMLVGVTGLTAGDLIL